MTSGSVLISGAGIAGPTLAYWLSRAGFKPTLVEQAPGLRTGGHVIDFWGLGYDIAERMGVLDDLNRLGYHMRRLEVVDDTGAVKAAFGTRVLDELTGGRLVTVRRSDLSRLLFARAEPLSECIFDDHITHLEDDGDGVNVSFARTPARRFDLVIGADGLHSNVRKLAFRPDAWVERSLGYHVAAFEASGYQPRKDDVFVIHNAPGRMMSRIALRDDRTLFLFVFADAQAAGAEAFDLRDQKALLRRLYTSVGWESAAILDVLDRAEDIYFDRVSQILMPSWSRGRIALIGDAAFCVSLMAGQGAALAMTAAYVLAGELGRSPENHSAALRRYEEALRDYTAIKQKGAVAFSGAFAPRTEFGTWFRNLVIRATVIPGVARFAFGREIIDRLELPEYAWD